MGKAGRHSWGTHDHVNGMVKLCVLGKRGLRGGGIALSLPTFGAAEADGCHYGYMHMVFSSNRQP